MATKEEKRSTTLYTIDEGPSRDFLIDVFKYSHDDNAYLPIRLHLKPLPVDRAAHPGYTVTNLHINSISHEDGSGQSFIFSGYCYADIDGCGNQHRDFSAYYNAKKREGFISFRK